MFTDTIIKCAANAARIACLSANNPLGFWVSSAMAGVYMGLGIILIFTLGNLLDLSVRPLVMGATFGVALMLVIIADSELFIGHTAFLTFGVKADTTSHRQAWAILPQTWLSNLVGSVFVAMLYSQDGGNLLPVDTSIVHSVALAKTTAPTMVLFFKGVLCNWLVCLTIWMALRTEGATKFIAIWWCLLAFIASGYRHSIANMTLFALSWSGNHSETYTLAGIGHNLLWVALGSALSGVIFMGLGYWYTTPKANRPVADKFNQTETAAGQLLRGFYVDHLPIFCQLRDRNCLIIGGDDIAERKAKLLLDVGTRLTANALALIPQFTAWADADMLALVEEPFDESLLDICWLAIVATDNDALNQRVSEAAEARHIFCNVAGAPRVASFIMPSIIDRSPPMIAISSGGTSPVLARLLREKLELLLPLHLGRVAKYAGQLRRRVRQQFATMGERRRFWEKLFVNDRLAQSLASNDQKAITETTEQLINEPLDHRGEVMLVGAGPGDAGPLILKGLRQIQQADMVVYDRLVSGDIMNLVRRGADRAFVGKRAGYYCVPRGEINQILLREAQKGKRVVRLKGGDPFIFGRGREEPETLCNAGIPFSMVPGITTASGCSAYSGIPLTHRDYAQSVRLITGHLKTGGELDWGNLAAERQILVFYMGLNQVATIQQKLIEYGMPGEMSVAIVENGTAVTQHVVDGTLTQLGELVQQMNSPLLIIIGRVVGLCDKLDWFSNH